MPRVLLLDEDRSQLEEMKSWLPASEYGVEISTQFADAVDSLSKESFDAAVCDIRGDVEESFGFLSKGLAASRTTRFIVTAGANELPWVLRSLKQGAYSYLVKPPDMRDFVRTVDSACQDKDTMERVNIQLGEAGWVELQMPSSERTMHRLDRFFRLMYEGAIDEETLEDVSLCFREVVKNAIEWGNKSDVNKPVKISHMLFQDEFVFKIEDNGEGYDISAMLDGTDDLVAMEEGRQSSGKRPGGLGMTMVKGLMDQVIYNKRGNMIILSKSLIPVEERAVGCSDENI